MIKKVCCTILLFFIFHFNLYSDSSSDLSADNIEYMYINLTFDFDKNAKVDERFIYDLSNDPLNIMPKKDIYIPNSSDSSADMKSDNSADSKKSDNSSPTNDTKKEKASTAEDARREKRELEAEKKRVANIKKKYITEPDIIENINKNREIFFFELSDALFKDNIVVVNEPFPREIKDESNDIDNSSDIIKKRKEKRVKIEIPEGINPINCKIVFLIYNRGEYNLITNINTDIRVRIFIDDKSFTKNYLVKSNIDNPIEQFRIATICSRIAADIQKVLKKRTKLN